MSFDSRKVASTGIGAVFSPSKGRVRFLSLDPACGAFQAGVRKDDLLEAIVVDGCDNPIHSVAQAAALVKGDPGTSLKMIIRHVKCLCRFDFTVSSRAQDFRRLYP
jgi:hypothetical protein